MNRKFVLIGACAVAAVAAYSLLRPNNANYATNATLRGGGEMVAVLMPPITGNAAIGQRIFDNACAACHGTNAVGVDGAGPPLIHAIYEPSHHADESFQRAVAGGVKSHHWRFGDMPPIEGLARGEVAMVIDYIREIQRANGID